MAEELSEPKVVQESAVSAAAMQGHEPFSGDKMWNAEDCALIDESGGSENGKYLFKPDDELPPSKPCYYTGAGHETPSVDPYNVSNANGNGNGACYQINGHYNISTRQTVRPPRLLGTVELKNLFSTFPNLRHPNPNYMDVINFARDAGAFHRGRKKAGEKSKPKSCVMCGLPNVGDGGCFIRRQNKGVCTECDCDYWIQISTGCLIKWCKGCKNFLAGAKFGKKVHASKCETCRSRVRTSYTKKKGSERVSLRNGTGSAIVGDKLCCSKPLVLGCPSESEEKSVLLLSPGKNPVECNCTSSSATISSKGVSRPLTTSIQDAIAAMSTCQAGSIIETPTKRAAMMISSEDDQTQKEDTTPCESTVQQQQQQQLTEPESRTFSQSVVFLSPNGLSCRPSSNKEVNGRIASLPVKDILRDSKYLISKVVKWPSPKLMPAPVADAMVTMVQDEEERSTSVKKSFDRLGFLVSLLGAEAKSNEASGGAPSLGVTHQSPPAFFGPGMDEWVKKRKLSPNHARKDVQLDMANNNVNVGECTSFPGMKHRITIQSI